jgi:mRNA interferase MazF
MSNYPKRGDVYWVSLDPTVGSETQKTRPGLVLSNNIANKNSDRVIVGPITSSVKKIYPFEASITLSKGECKVMLDQIRAVHKTRFGNRIISASSEEMQEVERALKLTLGLS